MYKWFKWRISDRRSVSDRLKARGYPCAKGYNSSASQWLSGEQVRLCSGHPKVHFWTIVQGGWGGGWGGGRVHSRSSGLPDYMSFCQTWYDERHNQAILYDADLYDFDLPWRSQGYKQTNKSSHSRNQCIAKRPGVTRDFRILIIWGRWLQRSHLSIVNMDPLIICSSIQFFCAKQNAHWRGLEHFPEGQESGWIAITQCMY